LFSIIAGILISVIVRQPALVERNVSAHQWAVESTSMIDSLIYAMDAEPYGRSMKAWTVEWVHYLYSHSCETMPAVLTTGHDSDMHQRGPVYFLVGTISATVEREMTIPAGKSIFFPLHTYYNHYPCPYPGFKPAPGQTMEDFLKEGAADIVDHAREMSVTLDDVQFPIAEKYRVTSDLFYLTCDPALVCVDACVTTGPQPGIVDGYWVMLKPLAAGYHKLRFQARVVIYGVMIDVTYHITVK
jgi:hypothetical protein